MEVCWRQEKAATAPYRIRSAIQDMLSLACQDKADLVELMLVDTAASILAVKRLPVDVQWQIWTDVVGTAQPSQCGMAHLVSV